MEHKIEGVGRHTKFFADISLGILENLRRKSDITRLVYTVYVTEGGGDGKFRADGRQYFIRMSNIFRLCVERGAVDAGIVPAVLFATGATQFDLQCHPQFAHALEILRAQLDVFLQRFFRQIDHVRAEQRFAGLCKMRFAGIQQTVDPRQQIFSSVIRVKNYRYTISTGNRMDVMCSRYGAQNRTLMPFHLHALAEKEGSAAVRQLDDYR